jgi:hypothetical protein
VTADDGQLTTTVLIYEKRRSFHDVRPRPRSKEKGTSPVIAGRPNSIFTPKSLSVLNERSLSSRNHGKLPPEHNVVDHISAEDIAFIATSA